MITNEITSRLREIVELDEYLWRVQISMSVRQRMFRRRGWMDGDYLVSTMRSRIVEMRSAIKAECAELSASIPIVYSAMGVHSASLMYVLSIIVRVDMKKAESPAHLWRYFGYGVDNGRADSFRSLMGPTPVTWSNTARRVAGRQAACLIRKDGPYKNVWREQIAYQLSRGVIDRAVKLRARRYVIKLWLKHLWIVWRRQIGLPVGNHHLNDTTYLAAPFGWR